MKSETSSYKQIVKTTGIYGTAQLVNIVLGVVRSKVLAILLGTTGIGIIGLYQSIVDLSRAATGLGLDTGATRKIATTISSHKADLPKTLFTVNLWYLFTAILGALICIVFAKPLSIWAFDVDSYTLHIAALSLAVFLITLTAGMISSLQGMRKIPYMALASVLGSFLSLIVTIPVYYYWRIDGIIPMFIIINFIVFLVTFYFYRKIGVKPIIISIRDVVARGKEMVELGVYLVVAGIISAGSLLLVRGFLSREEGIEAVGLFHAAWITVILICGIILRSTNADFLPKLCSLIDEKNNEGANKYINEQTHIVLLITAPLVIGLIVFAQYVIDILYTSEFIVATNTFRWHLFAAFLKIISTPIATVALAKNRGGLHLICEIVFWGTYLLACNFLYPLMGLEGIGAAYLVAYLVYTPTVLFVAYKISDAMWDVSIIFMILVNVLFIFILYISFLFYSPNIILIGSIVFLLALAYSIYQLKAIVGFDEIIKWLKDRFRR